MPIRQQFPGCEFCFPDRNRILFETDLFYAMLSLGPIAEGHSLLIAKSHYWCCAAVPQEEQRQFLTAKQGLAELLKEEYGPCITFEHGRTASCVDEEDGSPHETTLCFHAHLHIVPTSVDLFEDLKRYFVPLQCESWDEIVEFYERNEEYLLYEDQLGEMTVFPGRRLPQYFLRLLLASQLGFPEKASWRQYKGFDVIKRSMLRLRDKALLH